MKLACQENLIPGESLIEKWTTVHQLGFEGIELRGTENSGLAARLPELREARRLGAYFPSVCPAMGHFIGDVDPEHRRDAIDNLKSQLSVVAELGGRGVITPASYGKTSRVLPSLAPTRTPEEDTEVLLEALRELGEHAASEGVEVFLEPLNRYADHMINTLEEAASLCDRLGLDSVKIMADLYHMNIEERDLPSAIRAFGPKIAHVHICDSNRFEPGCGHIDFASVNQALSAIDYSGFLAMECRLQAPPVIALRNVAELFLALPA